MRSLPPLPPSPHTSPTPPPSQMYRSAMSAIHTNMLGVSNTKGLTYTVEIHPRRGDGGRGPMYVFFCLLGLLVFVFFFFRRDFMQRGFRLAVRSQSNWDVAAGCGSSSAIRKPRSARVAILSQRDLGFLTSVSATPHIAQRVI